ncbi:hypothetical protein BDR03DRAFT_952557 [Suillus americanus]|nr:hypothetical protein BDR03DRAFT_952557 [Suillus americanus]
MDIGCLPRSRKLSTCKTSLGSACANHYFRSSPYNFNGVKVWCCTNGSMHVQLLEELYPAFSRPTPLDQAPSFGQAILSYPRPHPVHWWQH